MIVKQPPGLSDEHAEKFASEVRRRSSAWASSRTSRSGSTRPGSTTRCCARRTAPVYQLRRWYEQFYIDVEDITPEMTARFEFEVDTTRAVAEWEAEVAENLAARRTS